MSRPRWRPAGRTSLPGGRLEAMSPDHKPGAKRTSKALSHEEARMLVSKAWDGEVSADELRMLSEHLQACAECAEAAGRMRAFLGKVDDLLAGS